MGFTWRTVVFIHPLDAYISYESMYDATRKSTRVISTQVNGSLQVSLVLVPA